MGRANIYLNTMKQQRITQLFTEKFNTATRPAPRRVRFSLTSRLEPACEFSAESASHCDQPPPHERIP